MPLGVLGSAHTGAGRLFADDFNRADGGLGSNWTVIGAGLSILSNQVRGAGSANPPTVWATDCDTDDNWAQATFAVTSTQDQGISVLCRSSSTVRTFYEAYLSAWPTNPGLFLMRKINGSNTLLGSYAFTPAAGDVVRVEALGTTITAYLNGVARVQRTDSAITSGKRVGMGGWSMTFARLDDWSGGDL